MVAHFCFAAAMQLEVVKTIPLPSGQEGIDGAALEERTGRDTHRFDFSSPAWHAAWVQHHIPSDRWRAPVTVFRVIQGENNLGEMLFATQRISVLKVMSLGGYYWPFRGASIDRSRLSPALFAGLMAELISRESSYQVLRMAPVLANDPAIQTLCEQLRGRGWSQFTRETGRVFELEFASTESDLKAQMSASMLRNVLYMQRRTEKDKGPVTWRRYAGSGVTPDVLDEAASVEALSWVYAQQGDVKLVGAGNKAFWQQVIDGLRPGCDVVLWVLYVDGHPAAFSFHLETRSTVFILANGYVQEFNQYSLGSVLTYRVFLDAVQRGMRHLDWGSGDSGYKQKWGAAAGSSLHEHLFFGPTLLGKGGAFLFERAASEWDRVR